MWPYIAAIAALLCVVIATYLLYRHGFKQGVAKVDAESLQADADFKAEVLSKREKVRKKYGKAIAGAPVDWDAATKLRESQLQKAKRK